MKTIPAMSVSEIERAAKVLRALGHPLRLRVMQDLLAGERGVTEMVRRFGTSPSMMSQQLSLLEAQGLIRTRKVGAAKFCAMRNPDFANLFTCLKHHLELCFRLDDDSQPASGQRRRNPGRK